MKIGYLMQAGAPDLRQSPLTGPATHVRHVYQELSERGHVVSLLAMWDRERLWRTEDSVTFEPVLLRGRGAHPMHLIERGMRRVQYEFKLPYAALFESVRFAQACHQELAHCDLFYERLGWVGYGGGLAARQLGIPLIMEVNGDHLEELEKLGIAPKGLQRWLSVLLMKHAVKRAAHVVATGEGWRQRFLERWQVDPERVSVVENGSDMVERLSQRTLRAFQPAGASGETATIIYVGAFEPWHGVDILVEAFGRVVVRGIPARLLLVGDGSGYQSIRERVRDDNLEALVTFTGHLPPDQLAKRLSQADIAVSPYCGRVEFSGLKLLDYKAAGLPTVASGNDGQPAVIEHGRTGWIVPPCDVEALATGIALLCTEPELRRQLGQRARLEAEKCHSWRHTAQQLEGIFERVVES
jgi:glycosyltransferase involved in cell wall biosynthesis